MKIIASQRAATAFGSAALLFSAGVTASDDICRKIADFATATPQNTVRYVELKNDWSNLSKYCEHNNYDPGKTLCDWLIHNTSTEFMHVNVNDALTCISPDKSAIGIPRVTPDYLSGKYSSFSARHLSADYELTLEFAIGIKGQLDSLKISVAKEDW